jgi:hypothetical protein
MSNLPLWFERKFTFDFPAELYPNLCTRLRGTPARLEELARGLTRERLVLQPEGKWSIQENAGHLLDLEPLWFARVDDFLAGKPELASADLANSKTHEAQHNHAPSWTCWPSSAAPASLWSTGWRLCARATSPALRSTRA